MNLRFLEVTRDNWEECIGLKVHQDQEEFVASNAYSLIQAQYVGGLFPLCIYDGEQMVGFTMWEEDQETHDLGMCRLMIDQKFQNQGYGRASVIKLMELVRQKYGQVPFYTSIEPENVVAGELYMNLGFKKTGDLIGDEIVLKAQL